MKPERKDIIDRVGAGKELEKELKNRFQWSWLDEKYPKIKKEGKTVEDPSLGSLFANGIRKVYQAGYVFCVTCNEAVGYSNSGCSDIQKHYTTSKHCKKKSSLNGNYLLPCKSKYLLGTRKLLVKY